MQMSVTWVDEFFFLIFDVALKKKSDQTVCSHDLSYFC